MKRISALLLTFSLALSLSACGAPTQAPTPDSVPADSTQITLSDNGITVNGETASSDTSAAVYTANDIVYYEEGRDFTYGEGTEADAHSAQEAAAHTVVHITQPGTYVLSGKLSAGQVAVDLGENAEEDPSAVVTLMLHGVDITCTAAPAIIFYNVYECGDKDTPSKDVDTSAAGANVILADGTENIINGSYVARIYKPDTVELNEDGTEVEDAKKLHKYDGAFYSKMSMNVLGDTAGTGTLHITAENEGLDSELHLTIGKDGAAGPIIHITSGNDGINTNEDGISVTTIHSGALTITVSGETGEGDGIDSNGWLVINGGSVIAAACSNSMDSGIDADMGIHINGGKVIASGNMLDRIEDGGQTYAIFQFAQRQAGGTPYVLRDMGSSVVATCAPVNDYSILLLSNENLSSSNYDFWQGTSTDDIRPDTNSIQMAHRGVSFGRGGFGGGMMPQPEGMKPPEGFEPPQGIEPGGPRVPEEWENIDLSQLPWIPGHPEGTEPPDDMSLPENTERPDHEQPPQWNGPTSGTDEQINLPNMPMGEPSTIFDLTKGSGTFSSVAPVTE